MTPPNKPPPLDLKGSVPIEDQFESSRPNKPPRGDDWRIEMSPEIQAKIDADPKKAEALRIVLAEIRQALDGVATGKFADADDAMRALGAWRVGEQ